MAKIRLAGRVATDVVSGTVGQNTKFIKYLVAVSVGGQNNNPRLAGNSNSEVRTSYFAVMAFGKQAEFPIAKGVMVEIDGDIEIADFQLHTTTAAKKAVIVTPQHTTLLQGNVANYAKAYNVLGNFTKIDAEPYNPQSGNMVYNQTLAINRKVNETEYTSFFDIRIYGERGEKLFSKQLLNRNKVKSILVDGSISATYVTKEDSQNPGQKKEYFNCSINVVDFQIASWANNGQQQGQNQNMNTGANNASGNAYANQHANTQGNAYNATPENSYNNAVNNGYDINEEDAPF